MEVSERERKREREYYIKMVLIVQALTTFLQEHAVD